MGGEGRTIPPDWGPGLEFWVPDEGPDPEIPWPDNFEVCSVPNPEPGVLEQGIRREGQTYMAWPMFSVADPAKSINVFCAILEKMSPTALQD